MRVRGPHSRSSEGQQGTLKVKSQEQRFTHYMDPPKMSS